MDKCLYIDDYFCKFGVNSYLYTCTTFEGKQKREKFIFVFNDPKWDKA